MLAEAGGGGFVYESTTVNQFSNLRIYIDNTGASGATGVARSYFSEGNNITETYKQMYVGKNTKLYLDGSYVLVQVNDLTCDAETGIVLVPNNTIFHANKGRLSCPVMQLCRFL